MSTFIDQLILSFSRPSFIDNFLTAEVGAGTLFDLTYAPETIDLQSVTFATDANGHVIVDTSFGMPVLETIRSTATHERILPDPARTQVREEKRRRGRLEWVDVFLQVRLDAQVHDLSAPIQEITVEDLFHRIGTVNSLPELRTALLALYPESVVDAFFERFRITSIEEFQQRGNLFLTFVFEEPPPFDPEDPQAARTYNVNACILVVDQLDVAGALQRAQLCRSILQNEYDYAESFEGGEIKAPYAFIVIFPDDAVSNNVIPGLNANEIRSQIKDVLATEGMFAHFE